VDEEEEGAANGLAALLVEVAAESTAGDRCRCVGMGGVERGSGVRAVGVCVREAAPWFREKFIYFFFPFVENHTGDSSEGEFITRVNKKNKKTKRKTSQRLRHPIRD
jgi:hypothetical protein